MKTIHTDTIKDCNINFRDLFFKFYLDINDKVTKESILDYCKSIDSTWNYKCDDENNPPCIIEDNDCILEGYKPMKNMRGMQTFRFSFIECIEAYE